LTPAATAVYLAQNRLEAETIAAHIGFGPDLAIDRDHVALAARLHAKAEKKIRATEPGLILP